MCSLGCWVGLGALAALEVEAEEEGLEGGGTAGVEVVVVEEEEEEEEGVVDFLEGTEEGVEEEIEGVGVGVGVGVSAGPGVTGTEKPTGVTLSLFLYSEY